MFVEKLLHPLAASKALTRTETDLIMSEINQKMMMEKKEGSIPTNPHWVM